MLEESCVAPPDTIKPKSIVLIGQTFSDPQMQIKYLHAKYQSNIKTRMISLIYRKIMEKLNYIASVASNRRPLCACSL